MELLAHLHISRADIVAHTGGTILGALLSHAHPERVRKLVLLGPPAMPLSPEIMRRNAGPIRTSGLEAFVPLLENAMGEKARADPELKEILRKETVGHDKLAAPCAIEALAGAEFKGAWGGGETVIVCGTHDNLSTQEACDAMADLTGGRVVEMETGHSYPLEDPVKTAGVLKTIFDDDD